MSNEFFAISFDLIYTYWEWEKIPRLEAGTLVRFYSRFSKSLSNGLLHKSKTLSQL